MRAVIQRVRSAKVSVEGKIVGQINAGWLVLLGVGPDDGPDDLDYMVQKTAHLRAFPDDEGKMNRSVLDIKGEILAVSQFTLYGDCRKGRRPGFSNAAPPEFADALYQQYIRHMRDLGLKVATGTFAANMQVDLTNDGPVTFVLDSSKIL
jgi:D-tyrosyl-tRNA(Tyr) deacylase